MALPPKDEVLGVMQPSVLTGQVPVPEPVPEPVLLRCTNSQCRVDTYRPHSSKKQDQKCPSCYGTG